MDMEFGARFADGENMYELYFYVWNAYKILFEVENIFFPTLLLVS
jgi:hypothetical protein